MNISSFMAEYGEYLKFFKGLLPKPRHAESYRAARRNKARLNYRLCDRRHRKIS